jgi:hypothetical protein|tara:strand:+ start:452 stop:826 length:375 start_codon:yes stop_codon:yes gene_type:complete
MLQGQGENMRAHMIDCAVCEETFDLHSPEKKRAGGLRNHCPDCAEETAVPYLAVNGADGKMAGLTILAFDSAEDREKYKKAWHNNTGMNKGKSCHLSSSNTPMNGMKFRRVGENFGNSNHKGKL